MASSPIRGAPSLSLSHRVRCVPDPGKTVGEVLVGVGEQVSYVNVFSASRMGKAVVVFVTEESLVKRIIQNGIWVFEFFWDLGKLEATIVKLARTATYNELSKKKTFRLKKIQTKIRKGKGSIRKVSK